MILLFNYKINKMIEYTKQETEFKKLHKKLLDLLLFELASDFSSVFYKYGHERYIDGANMVNEINNL